MYSIIYNQLIEITSVAISYNCQTNTISHLNSLCYQSLLQCTLIHNRGANTSLLLFIILSIITRCKPVVSGKTVLFMN